MLRHYERIFVDAEVATGGVLQKNPPKALLKKKKIRHETCNFVKKETVAQAFSCELCEIFKKTFFTERL